MRVLFLDFDGVMHPAGLKGNPGLVGVVPMQLGFCEWLCFTDILEKLLEPNPDVKIAVISSWREVHPDDEIQDMLGALGNRYIGKTQNGEKLSSVVAYLEQMSLKGQSCSGYVILDDAVEDFKAALPEHVIHPPSHMGIADKGTQEAIKNWLAHPVNALSGGRTSCQRRRTQS